MKRRQLTKHLTQHGCVITRQGSGHTIYRNPANGRQSPVPRHIEIDDKLARKICRQLEIPDVK